MCNFTNCVASFAMESSSTMEDDSSDLSAYERKRLANIERNRVLMASLGMMAAAAPPGTHKATVPKSKRMQRVPLGASKASRAPTRRSARLQAQSPSAVQLEPEAGMNEGGPRVDYSLLPVDPAELDDNEFEVFAALRKWRLKRKRELDIEPYKICQNRTLCELVRRRRNDANWAVRGKTGNDDTSSSFSSVAGDLMECWGIGASKAAPSGFGHEMLAVLDRPALQEKLEQSRVVMFAAAT